MINKWSFEEEKILIDNAYEHTNKQIQDLLVEIGSNRSIYAIQNRKNKLGLKCSYNAGCFKKGNVPFNKGKKWADYVSKKGQENSRKTTFKKGNIPHNHRPVGSERITKDGYTEIKIKEPNKWQLKHRYIYEKKYGKIPDGMNLIFLDGNKQNIELSNLKLVSRAEDLIMNTNKLFTKDKELTNSGVLIAKVINKTNKLGGKE